MNQKFIPVAVLALGAIGYALYRPFQNDKDKLSRAQLIQIIIQLRKHIFSTLREIAYVANYLKVIQSDLQPKKIKQLIMRDGASAQTKLTNIEQLVLDMYGVKRENFQKYCNQASRNDIQIKMLLQDFKNDVRLALQGTVSSFNGPVPQIDGPKTIKIYRQITLRRMKIIQQKFMKQTDNQQCLKLQFQIQQYLEGEGIFHQKEPSQKIFLALLEYHYKNDSQFKGEFQALEHQFQQFIQQIKNKRNQQKKKEQQEK